MKRIVFSDLDGTLLNSRHEIMPATLRAIQSLQNEGVPFVIVSARSPHGIESVMKEYGFHCPIICLNGALILDEQRNTLFSKGIKKTKAARIVDFLEHGGYDTSWCIYAFDQWFVKDENDPRVIREASVVKAEARTGTVHSVDGDEIHKIMCICDPDESIRLEGDLKKAFPEENIVRSSDVLIEIVQDAVSKAAAVKELCARMAIPVQNAVAFGDNDNDLDMLECVGTGILMGNARTEHKKRISLLTEDNDSDGIYRALLRLQMI